MLNFHEKCDLSINFNDLTQIANEHSDHYAIKIFKHKLLGKILVLDNEIQHVERWSEFYHEMLVHFPISFIRHPYKVLIIGGGSLFAANEVLKYNDIKELDLIDFDKSVIDLVSKYYNHAKRVRKDPRFNFICAEAFKYLSNNTKKYDLVINDSIDLLRQSIPGKSNFFSSICSNLNNNGLCVDLVYRHIFEKETTIKMVTKLRNDFYSRFSFIPVPDYPGIFHILCIWSKSNKNIMREKIINDYQRSFRKTEENFLSCKLYNPRFHRFFTYLPGYFKEITGL
ncbi:MAG: hypothetical protein AB2L26_13285 [Ignavibacteria bacterium]